MRTEGSRRRAAAAAGVALAGLVLLGACAAGRNTAATGGELAGFWLGLWQGIISPITFIISLFNDNVNVYEVRNNGNWYNFGFILGVSSVFSGGGRGAASAGSRRPRQGTPRDAS